MNDGICLFEIGTGYEADPPVYVLAANIREALAKYKNDVAEISNVINSQEGNPAITAADVDDPASIIMLGDCEQVIL